MTGSMIWLASYPKSGNTWLRLLLANLLSGRDEAVDINRIDLPSRSVVHHHNIEEQTLIDSSLLLCEEVDNLRPHVAQAIAEELKEDIFVKLHDAYRLLPDGVPLFGRARAALYVIRDPRDVAVSFASHNGRSIGRTIKLMSDPHAIIGGDRKRFSSQVPQLLQDWSGHVCNWIGQRDVPVHVIRYEDLHSQPVATLQAAASFLGLPVTDERVEHAFRCTRFSELQRKEQEAGFRERAESSTAQFFRSGKAGGWREVLSAEQQQAITQAHGEVMARFGYL